MFEEPFYIYDYHNAFGSLSNRGKRVIKKQDPSLKTSGGIIRYHTKYGDYKYALVQGKYAQKWSFPKGHMKKDENSYQCCIREIREETGLDWLPIPNTSLQIGFGYYYVFEVEAEYPLHSYDETEIMNTKWVTIDEMRKMSLNTDVSQYVRLLTN